MIWLDAMEIRGPEGSGVETSLDAAAMGLHPRNTCRPGGRLRTGGPPYRAGSKRPEMRGIDKL